MGFDLLLFLAELRAEGLIQDDRDIELIADGLKPLAIELLIKMYDKINGLKENAYNEL